MRAVVLGTDEKLFRSMHRRYADACAPPPWDRLDVHGLADALREELRAVWSARVVAEYRSMVVFSHLIARLPEAGLPLEVSSAASRLLQDEARHTELCAGLADRLGGRHDALVAPRELDLSDGLAAHLFVARWTVSMFCVGESASVGLLHALRAESRDPCVDVVLDTLLRDEALHDRFGWALARLAIPRLTDDEREWLGAELAHVFAHYDWANGRNLRPDGGALPDEGAPAAGVDALAAHPDDAARLGFIAPLRYARAWYDRLDRVILPALDGLGLAAYEAWSLRHEVGAAAAPRADGSPGRESAPRDATHPDAAATASDRS